VEGEAALEAREGGDHPPLPGASRAGGGGDDEQEAAEAARHHRPHQRPDTPRQCGGYCSCSGPTTTPSFRFPSVFPFTGTQRTRVTQRRCDEDGRRDGGFVGATVQGQEPIERCHQCSSAMQPSVVRRVPATCLPTTSSVRVGEVLARTDSATYCCWERTCMGAFVGPQFDLYTTLLLPSSLLANSDRGMK